MPPKNKSNPWSDIGKLFDPLPVQLEQEKPEQTVEQKEENKKKAKKAIRRKHGKDTKI